MFDERPTTEAVENPPSRFRDNAGLVLAFILLGAVILFRTEITRTLEFAWDVSIGPLVAADWQARSQAPAVVRAPAAAVSGKAASESGGALAAGGQPTPAAGAVNLVPVALSSGFRPVNFEISAASVPVMLDDESLFFKPASGDRRYGSFRFRNGLAYRFELSDGGSDTVLKVDLDGDGDFGDAGGTYSSPTDAFEVTVALPMEKVTGSERPGGDYRLWLYRTPEGGMQQVVLTQLVGSVYLDGRSYTAYVVENSTIDGDFSNDGLYVDWNRDGVIQPGKEFIPQGGTLVLGDSSYAFLVRR